MPPDETVIRTGKLFEIGEYEDKAFSFDEDDLKRAVETFQGCDLDLEHVPSVLDGKLGRVARIFPGNDGKTLMGEVHLPRWLDTLLEDGNRKVSATWDRTTKQLRGLALVRNPRISDAALMAAFSAAADTPPARTQTTKTGQRSRKHMNLREWLKGKAQEEGIEVEDFDAAFSRDPDPKVSELDAALKAKDAEIENLRKAQEQHAAKFAQVEAERRQAEAVTFTAASIQAHRIAPASQDALTALAARVAETDSTATFSDGEKPTSTLLAEFVNSLPDLSIFTKPQVEAGQLAALFSLSETKGLKNDENEPNEDNVENMLEATREGREILAQIRANGKK